MTILDPGPGAVDGAPPVDGQSSKRRKNARTVSFGDSSAVKSLPAFTVVAFLSMMLFWWLTTRIWGMDQAFAAQFFADNPDITSEKQLVAACTRADDCEFSQVFTPQQFPSVSDTWDAAVLLFTEGFQNRTIWEQTWASLWRIIRGMFFGTIFGVPIGMAMGLFSKARGFFDAPVEFFRPIPPLALIPLFIAIFGIGDAAAIPLLVFASLWIMIIAARSGMRNVQLSKVRAAYSLGASRRQVLTKVLIPNALPEIFTGFRIALGVSWGTLVAAELVGTDTGLGAMIFQARNFTRLDIIVVGIAIIAILGVLMDVFMRFLESILIPWQGKG